MSFAPRRLGDADASFCALDQLSNGFVWCSTPSGLLARFCDICECESILKASTDTSVEVMPQRLVAPRRPIDFAVLFLKVSASEKMALLAGYCEGRPHLAVVSLPDGQQTMGQMETYNHVSCVGDFIFNRPGMKLQQLEWWPGDDPRYFVVLSGNCLALYDAYSVSVPYATYRLQFSDVQFHSGFADCGTATAFSFIKDTEGWAAFAICILRDDGSVYVLCPIVVPDIAFDRDHIKALIPGEDSPLTNLWHRTIFSRTALNQVSAASSDINPTVLSRALSSDWKYSPVLQGPINQLKYPAERGYQALLSLSNDVLVTASGKGRIIFSRISEVLPSFNVQETRMRAPHVMVQQDCPRGASKTRMTHISEATLAGQDGSFLKLLKLDNAPDILVATDTHLIHVDCSTLDAPATVACRKPSPLLGCVLVRSQFLSAQPADQFQLKCSVLWTDSEPGHHSKVEPVTTLDLSQAEEPMETEQGNLEKISALRDQLNVAYDKIASLCASHDSNREAVAGDIKELHAHLKTQIADAAVSVEASGNDPLSKRYKDVLSQICTEVEALDPSAVSASSQVQVIEECMKKL